MNMQLLDALTAGNASVRLQAALAAGTERAPGYVDALVARCGVEPDFFVRDMLTWALTRLPADLTVPRLLAELDAPGAQARSQALHTLSKIGDVRAWPALTPSLLRDPDDEVARTAWRTAVALVPDDERPALAADLASQFGRGNREMRLSLSRALAGLGEAAEPVVGTATSHHDAAVRAHALATARLLRDPDAAFDLSVDEARRVFALGPDREGQAAC